MLGGSRHLTNIPQEVVDKLNDHIESKAWFLVGDAIGADSLFQRFLKNADYKRVVVFTSMAQPRNNFGKWESRCIDTGLKSQSAAKHTVKDRKMVELANEGLMLWDNESAGTLANAIDFIHLGKSCFFWTPKDGHLWNLDSKEGLNSLLETNLAIAQESQKRLDTYRNRENKKLKSVDEKGLF